MLALNAVIFNGMIIAATEDLKVQYIPDDGFYYLSLARNYSTYGIWSFDSGISTTSGFHLLFAYLLSSAFSLFHFDVNNFVTFGVILSLLFVLFSIATMWFWGFKQKNVLFLMFLVLIISSRNFVYNTVSITEWSLTILISSMYCVWFFTKYINPVIKRIDVLILFILGFSLSIARTDSGILPFSILVSTLFPFLTTSKRSRLFATMGLLGTLIGLLVVFTHNYLFTGEILQSSAMMKAYWAQLFPSDYYSGSILVTEIIGFPGLFLLAILIVIAVVPKFINKSGNSSPNSHTINNSHILMIVSAGVCVLGYTLVYSRNVDIQPWYTANLITPVIMAVFGISDYLTVTLHWKGRLIFPLFILLIIFFNISNLYPINTFRSPWPHQKYMYQAGLYLNENPLDGRVGSWNAGIIGYYEGGHVVNLDGLVNNDIYPYAVNNNLPAYLSSRDIYYLMDFEQMLTIEGFRVRGGYDDNEFLGDLKPQKVFDRSEYLWNHMTLYSID
jgi:hypothetical protein